VSAAENGRRPLVNTRAATRVTNLLSGLAQTSALIEGVVTAIDYEYDEEDGPRTVVTLSSVKAHAGNAQAVMQLRNFGGPRPDGGYSVVSDQARFVKGATYIVFLRNTSWKLSPVLNSWAFRVTDIDGKEALVDTVGSMVLGLDDSGFALSTPIFEPVGFVGKAPARRNEDPINMQPMTRAQLATAVNAHLLTRRMQLTTDFYDMPIAAVNWREGVTSPASGASNQSANSTESSGPMNDQPPSEIFSNGIPATESVP